MGTVSSCALAWRQEPGEEGSPKEGFMVQLVAFSVAAFCWFNFLNWPFLG